MDSKQIQLELFQVTKNIKKLLFHNIPSQVKHSEYRALGVIYDEQKKQKDVSEGIRTSDLAAKLRISKPAVSKLVNSLESNGYIIRKTGKEDKRNTFISLTDQGKKKTETLIKQMDLSIQKILNKMGEEDSKELIRLLNKVYQILDSEIKEFHKDGFKECE